MAVRAESLFRNDGEQGFSDVSEEERARTGRRAWGADIVDLDSDGLLDLFAQATCLRSARSHRPWNESGVRSNWLRTA